MGGEAASPGERPYTTFRDAILQVAIQGDLGKLRPAEIPQNGQIARSRTARMADGMTPGAAHGQTARSRAARMAHCAGPGSARTRAARIREAVQGGCRQDRPYRTLKLLYETLGGS